jgi:Trk-type K+ transport system membrane component
MANIYFTLFIMGLMICFAIGYTVYDNAQIAEKRRQSEDDKLDRLLVAYNANDHNDHNDF